MADRESTIRDSLDVVEAEMAEHFQKVGVTEREARRRARKMVKQRNIGERVEKQARHDRDKAQANAERQQTIERAKAEAREKEERQRHAQKMRETGRKFFT